MKEDFLIPINDSIKAFHHHLNSHDRTILSARFGDGKSFFLNHFMQDEAVKEEYVFLTIFPVNYQVVENRDIFDLIKRDILLQLFVKGVIEPGFELSDIEALSLYVHNKPLSFLSSFAPLLSTIDAPKEVLNGVATIKAFKSLYDAVKSKIHLSKVKSDEQLLDDFFDKMEKNPIVGIDSISQIIRRAITIYKNNHKDKKIALIIEDMDRMDPAHLFRILNVFSAHIDFCYQLGGQPDETLIGNKFGLDKIVFVLDGKNLERIYHHFYGADTNFDGYIEKFCSSNHFEYSLQHERENLVYSHLVQTTGMAQECIAKLLKPKDINDGTIRNIVYAITETEKFIISVPEVTSRDGKAVKFHPSILHMIAILRKLKFNDTEIQERILASLQPAKPSSISMLLYIAPYLSLICHRNAFVGVRFLSSTSVGNYVRVDGLNADGTAQISTYAEMNNNYNVDNKIRNAICKIMDMVAR